MSFRASGPGETAQRGRRQGGWSGAGHDAQHLTALAPALLLFVPLHDGESHTPSEGADADEYLAAMEIAGGVFRGLAAS